MTETRCGLYTKHGAGVPLEGVEIDASIVCGHASAKVRQRYVNREAKPVEAVYTFPLPSDGTLTGFAMTCAGRRIEGVVKAREDAFREYDEAISQGHGGALLDQERPNVFTAQIGNLLPNEETLIEVEFVQKLRADEGILRWSVPTLVAPRYISGTLQGNRTGHGRADPTDLVPDADRITPPIGSATYGLKLTATFDLGKGVRIESPSHAISTVEEQEGRVRVTFSSAAVALDRDVVLTARNLEKGPITAVSAHKADGPGAFALTIVPDLFDGQDSVGPQEVVFVIDTSGSMMGASLPEAQSALRLCLRHLREGDRFNIIAFNTDFRSFSPEPVVFTQRTLEEADKWVGALHAAGGTEMLQPLLHALKSAPNAIVVLLTDGEVGNEEQIVREALAARQRARIYSFGIGTNVSDVLLRDLARETQGAVEFIHPGERVDEKVTAQFARAVAPRIDEVKIEFDGVDVQELTPSPLPPLVDGDAWVLFGRYTRPGRGRAQLKGLRHLKGEDRTITLSIDVALPERADAPHLQKLWARERIRDLESVRLTGRRADANDERIKKLALEYQLVTKFTSFVLVEHREGARLASGQPETRVIPVNVPAGWEMFGQQGPVSIGMLRQEPIGAMIDTGTPVTASRTVARAHAPGVREMALGALSKAQEAVLRTRFSHGGSPVDPVTAVLERQLASGLWEPAGGGDDAARVLATARALLELLDLGVTTSHRTHGAQVRKAVAALAALLPEVAAKNAALAEFAASVAWLLSTGPRSRREIEKALAKDQGLQALRPQLENEGALRTRVHALSAQLR